MKSILSEKVLVLNRSWVAVNVATVRRALGLICLDAARIVGPDDFTTYNFEGWVELSKERMASSRKGTGHEDLVVRSACFEFRIPEVIVLTGYNGYYAKEVRCSRRNIFERDGNHCQYCGKRNDQRDMTIDHVLPRSRGGNSTWENMVLACFNCNSRKGNKLPHEANMKLLTKPVKPRWASRQGVKVGAQPKKSWERFLIGS